MKKLICVFSLVLTFVLALSSFAFGCNMGKGKDEKSYTFNRDYLLGTVDPCGDFGGGVDKGITAEWLGDCSKLLGAKSYRVMVGIDGNTGGLVNVDENNNLSFNNKIKGTLQKHLNFLIAAGVEQIIFQLGCYVFPYELNYMYGYSAPDPDENFDEYISWLDINAKAVALISKAFPEIKIFEMGNEPDLNGGLHKHGWSSDASNKDDYRYSNEQLACIVSDLCWFAKKELKASKSTAKVATPGFSFHEDKRFLDKVYEAIESKTLPAGQEYSDVDPDNYFDVISYHPYCNAGGGLVSQNDIDEWTSTVLGYYDICKKHGDGEKPHIWTEFGWTDWNSEDLEIREMAQRNIATNFEKCLAVLKAKMPFVITCCCFRVTTMYTQQMPQDIKDSETGYGMFYNKDDPEFRGRPQPCVKAIRDFFYGKGSYDANVSWFIQKYGCL